VSTPRRHLGSAVVQLQGTAAAANQEQLVLRPTLAETAISCASTALRGDSTFVTRPAMAAGGHLLDWLHLLCTGAGGPADPCLFPRYMYVLCGQVCTAACCSHHFATNGAPPASIITSATQHSWLHTWRHHHGAACGYTHVHTLPHAQQQDSSNLHCSSRHLTGGACSSVRPPLTAAPSSPPPMSVLTPTTSRLLHCAVIHPPPSAPLDHRRCRP
jgi:hypothetical protein